MTCPNCKTDFSTSVSTCTKCGYPFSGSDEQKSEFIGNQVLKVGEIDDEKVALKNARLVLYIIGGINILVAFFMENDRFEFLFGTIIGLTFAGFAFFLERRPILFLAIPLCLLLFFYTLEALFDPASIISGIGSKIAYVAALVYGIIRVRKAQALRKESEYLGGH